MVAGLGPLELVIILMVALMGLVVPVMVLWFVFVAGRRKGVQDAENRGRPAD